MFSQMSVILFMVGGVWPLDRQPPWADTPLGRHSPWADTPPQQTATVVDGTHPTGMHSCFSEHLIYFLLVIYRVTLLV